jgi:hypothetical protein
MVFSRCAANISHALAIASSERLASGSLKLWTSRRHLSALRRYRSTNSDTSRGPHHLKRRHFCTNGIEKNSFRAQCGRPSFCRNNLGWFRNLYCREYDRRDLSLSRRFHRLIHFDPKYTSTFIPAISGPGSLRSTSTSLMLKSVRLRDPGEFSRAG